MMDWLTKGIVLAVCAAVGWLFWRAIQPQPAFRVRLRDCLPQTLIGTVTAAFSERVAEIATEHRIEAGEVVGYRQGDRIRLRFSREFPAEACQQLRNWWAIHGWSLPRRTQLPGRLRGK